MSIPTENIDFDDPNCVDVLRLIITNDLKRIHLTGCVNKREATMKRMCDEYYPDDIKKQANLFLCVMESIAKSEKVGLKGIGKTILDNTAKKYNVTGAITIEKIAVYNQKYAGIIGRDD